MATRAHARSTPARTPIPATNGTRANSGRLAISAPRSARRRPGPARASLRRRRLRPAIRIGALCPGQRQRDQRQHEHPDGDVDERRPSASRRTRSAAHPAPIRSPRRPRRPRSICRPRVVGPTPTPLIEVNRARAAGDSIAAATPCTTRPATSRAAEGASPQARDAAVNPTRPMVKPRREPTRSATRPPTMRNPPKANVYAVTTHCSPPGVKPRSRSIAGSALTTTVASSTTTNWATQVRRSPKRGLVTTKTPHVGNTTARELHVERVKWLLMETARLDTPLRPLLVVAGNLALDFANTIDDPGGPDHFDHIQDMPRLLTWARISRCCRGQRYDELAALMQLQPISPRPVCGGPTSSVVRSRRCSARSPTTSPYPSSPGGTSAGRSPKASATPNSGPSRTRSAWFGMGQAWMRSAGSRVRRP